AVMNRSADWLHQAEADLAQARLSADAEHHEWACFASCDALVLTSVEVESLLASGSRMARELKRDLRWIL
ncbi:MAG: HEPN domain-containing protein, partial [Vulcanococcus sp.]